MKASKTESLHESASRLSPVQRLTVLLIDDDPMFGAVLKRTAKRLRIAVDTVPPEGLTAAGLRHRLAKEAANYDVVIIDWDLAADVGGVEVAGWVSLPVILCSRRGRAEAPDSPWPESVKRFLHKKFGAEALLDEALAVAAEQAKAELVARLRARLESRAKAQEVRHAVA